VFAGRLLEGSLDLDRLVIFILHGGVIQPMFDGQGVDDIENIAIL
jgi:hypothetical protein